MKCPKCSGKTSVTDTRHPTSDEVLRSRVCNSCGNTFHTIEFEAHADEVFEEYWRKARHPYKAYEKGENK